MALPGIVQEDQAAFLFQIADDEGAKTHPTARVAQFFTFFGYPPAKTIGISAAVVKLDGLKGFLQGGFFDQFFGVQGLFPAQQIFGGAVYIAIAYHAVDADQVIGVGLAVFPTHAQYPLGRCGWAFEMIDKSVLQTQRSGDAFGKKIGKRFSGNFAYDRGQQYVTCIAIGPTAAWLKFQGWFVPHQQL